MSKFNLQLCEVTKSYEMVKSSKIQVLKEVNLSVSKGELVSLTGPSGAGKSTLLHIAGLLDELDSGEVLIDGLSVRNCSEQERTFIRREKIGFVYQFHHLISEFTALDNVALPQLASGKEHKQAIRAARELLEEVGLSERILHRPGELSGGEQQRVALCRALVNNPMILLADEPTGNLDFDASLNVYSLIEKMTRKLQISSVVATHDLDLANRMDRKLNLKGGVLSFADAL